MSSGANRTVAILLASRHPRICNEGDFLSCWGNKAILELRYKTNIEIQGLKRSDAEGAENQWVGEYIKTGSVLPFGNSRNMKVVGLQKLEAY